MRDYSHPLPDCDDRVTDDYNCLADSVRQKSCQLFYSKNRANFFTAKIVPTFNVPRGTKISEKMLDFLKFLAPPRQ